MLGPMLLALMLTAATGAPADLSAVGVVVSAQADRSTAILRSQGASRVVRVGENAFGGKVLAVAADGVSMDFGGERIQVHIRAGQAPAAVSAAPRAAAPEDPNTPARTMMRAEVQRRIADETQSILRETAIAPVSGDSGQITGFALTKLPAGGSLLTDAGLRPGDVITQINGTPIDSLPTLISLWPRLQNERQIQAVVLRNGQPVSLSVTLK
jgi:general secretion pathway protein C